MNALRNAHVAAQRNNGNMHDAQPKRRKPAYANDNSLPLRAANDNRKIQAFNDNEQNYTSDRNRQRNQRRLPHLPNKKIVQLQNSEEDTPSKRIVRASLAGTMIMWSMLPFYVPQLLFWMIGLAGLGIETVPIADFIFPGKEVFMLSWLIIAAIGTVSMFYAVWIFNLRRVDCFGGTRTLVFMCCLGGYFVFFLNIFPFFVGWVFFVVYKQRKGSQEN